MTSEQPKEIEIDFFKILKELAGYTHLRLAVGNLEDARLCVSMIKEIVETMEIIHCMK